MPRVKRGTVRQHKRAKLLKQTKGYMWGRKKLTKLAKTAVLKAGVHAYRGRKLKKRVNRQIWTIRINAAVRAFGLSYSRFIDMLKKKEIKLDRKVLSELAANYPNSFAKFVESIK